MDFEKAIKNAITQAKRQKNKVENEKQTQSALIEPMLRALGYDTSNPDEVCHQYTCDNYLAKKDMWVDYAIMSKGQPVILIEAKKANARLNVDNAKQLFYYFAREPTKVGLLTNGIVYKFYSDFKTSNIMDKKPFFEFNIETITPEQIEHLKMFRKSEFDLTKLTVKAWNLYKIQNIVDEISKLIDEPTPEFIKLCVRGCELDKSKKLTDSTAIKNYRQQVKQAFQEVIHEHAQSLIIKATQIEEDPISDENTEPTEEEWNGYHIVQAICAKLVTMSRITMRDNRSYCPIFLDGKNNKPIIRMYFNDPERKFIMWFDDEWEEHKEPIENVEDIYRYEEQIRATVQNHLDGCRTTYLREKKKRK